MSRSRTRNPKANNVRDLALLHSTLTEVVAVCRTLGFSTREIAATVNKGLKTAPQKPAFPVRHGISADVAAVLVRWKLDARYCDGSGQPLVLPFEGAPVSFTSLVRQVLPALDAGIAKELLLEGQAIHVDAKGFITRLKEYLPVYGGAGAIYAELSLANLRTCARVQRRVMSSKSAVPLTSGAFGFGGALLHCSKWDEFRWMTRALIQSMHLIDEWVERHSVPIKGDHPSPGTEYVEPTCSLLIDFPGDAVTETTTQNKTQVTRGRKTQQRVTARR